MDQRTVLHVDRKRPRAVGDATDEGGAVIDVERISAITEGDVPVDGARHQIDRIGAGAEQDVALDQHGRTRIDVVVDAILVREWNVGGLVEGYAGRVRGDVYRGGRAGDRRRRNVVGDV